MALDDDLLQRYYDGDLDPTEERRFASQIATDSSAQRRLAELAQLSDLMRSPVLEAAHGLDSDALFARIEAGIGEQKALGFGERLRLVGSEWMEHRKGLLVPAMASVAAAAAVLLILLAPRHVERPLVEGGGPSLAHGSSIENVDFGQSTGTVFQVESQGVTAAVVWISDDEEEAQ